MNGRLTPDRIEAAKEHLNHDQLVYIGHGKEFTDCVENCETALAALDLAERFRWRSIAELREEMKNIDPLKQLEDKTPVLAQSVAWGKCVITTKGRLIDVPYEYSAWMPLPEWEG